MQEAGFGKRFKNSLFVLCVWSAGVGNAAKHLMWLCGFLIYIFECVCLLYLRPVRRPVRSQRPELPSTLTYWQFSFLFISHVCLDCWRKLENQRKHQRTEQFHTERPLLWDQTRNTSPIWPCGMIDVTCRHIKTRPIRTSWDTAACTILWCWEKTVFWPFSGLSAFFFFLNDWKTNDRKKICYESCVVELMC